MITDWDDKIINLKLLISYGLDEIQRLEKLYGKDEINTLKKIMEQFYRSPVVDDLNRANENYYRIHSDVVCLQNYIADYKNDISKLKTKCNYYKKKCKKYRATIKQLKEES